MESTFNEPVSGICTGTEWKNVVAAKRHATLEGHLKFFQQDTGESHLPADKIFEGIKVIDKDYLGKKCTNSEWQNEMKQVAKDFQLNTEQKHAFYTVPSHSCHLSSDQLKMHIGGMGGKGKLQVLKALVEFFKHKKESHQFVIL